AAMSANNYNTNTADKAAALQEQLRLQVLEVDTLLAENRRLAVHYGRIDSAQIDWAQIATNTDGIDWESISRQLEGRSADECRMEMDERRSSAARHIKNKVV
ncbi:hypothetical protein HK405_004608, partial [Cladochytrium tenue]